MPDLSGCPGQDARSLTAEDVPCPECSYDVEFFSDENARKCPRCGYRVMRERNGNCADWCPAAGTCAMLRGQTPTQAE
ncbi:MAG: phosphohydrolase [Coriobacteriia bacterium]